MIAQSQRELAELARRSRDLLEAAAATPLDLPSSRVGMEAARSSAVLLADLSARGVVPTRETLIAFEQLTRASLRVMATLAARPSEGDDTPFERSQVGELLARSVDLTTSLHRSLEAAYRGFFGSEPTPQGHPPAKATNPG